MNIDKLMVANKTIESLKQTLVARQIEHDNEIRAIEEINDNISTIVNARFKTPIAERDRLLDLVNQKTQQNKTRESKND